MTHKQLFESLSKTVPYAESWIVSSMPRGGLQLVQPGNVNESLHKGYLKDFHVEDAATWRAIGSRKVVRASDVSKGSFENSRYFQEFMQPVLLQHLAVAPLAAPVFDGYGGALHVYRTRDQGDFTEDHLKRLGDIAREMDNSIANSRKTRQHTNNTLDATWSHRPAVRQFILDSRLRPVMDKGEALDERLREQLIQDAKKRLDSSAAEIVTTDRIGVPDSRGDLWTFRVVLYRKYPALGDGAFVFYCLQPESRDWAALRTLDIDADVETARLIPSLQFMQQEFHRGPTLNEIARTVHLSPFHYHRRFTELMGITPKHLLLECQIYEAKHQLVAGAKDLMEIASSCGFAHQSHFTSRFKQAAGLTPTRWRRMALRSMEAVPAR